MKIFIAGATGRVAAHVIAGLTAKGHTVVGGSRHPEALERGEGRQGVFLDLHASVEALSAALAGMDAVYFLAGSRGKDLLQTDAFGAVKLAKAAAKAGVRRFILLSSIFALEPQRWAEEPSLAGITNYNIAKFFADQWLVSQSGLDYTIVQPTVLTEEPGTGRIETDPPHDGRNPIPDVAAVLTEVLDRPNTVGKVIRLRGGETPPSGRPWTWYKRQGNPLKQPRDAAVCRAPGLSFVGYREKIEAPPLAGLLPAVTPPAPSSPPGRLLRRPGGQN